MNTSTREPRVDETEGLRVPRQPRWQRRGLSPIRGLIFIGAFLAIIATLALNYDIVWDALVQFVPWLFQFISDIAVGAFELVGMAPGVAGWAAIYLGVVVALAALYILIREAIVWNRFVRDLLYDYRAMYAHLYATWSTDTRISLVTWWNNLDTLGRVFAIAGTLLILIPLFIGLSVGLGMLVALVL